MHVIDGHRCDCDVIVNKPTFDTNILWKIKEEASTDTNRLN